MHRVLPPGKNIPGKPLDTAAFVQVVDLLAFYRLPNISAKIQSPYGPVT
jgi:hypothetical protein